MTVALVMFDKVALQERILPKRLKYEDTQKVPLMKDLLKQLIIEMA